MSLFTPVNQKRLTNISVVRLKKGGNRYELACYPNKVRAWRDKLEMNLDEVLQVRCVFNNVSKGQFANEKEVYKDFKSEDLNHIIMIILEQGQLQLTEKERQVEHQNLFRDTAKIISERCVNPDNNRPYTVTMVEKMMKDCHISLKANKTAKQHALEVIKQLRSTAGLKISPAMMEAVITLEQDAATKIKVEIHQLCTRILREGITPEGLYELVVVIEPEKYGVIETLLHSEVKGRYGVEIIGNTRHMSADERSDPSGLHKQPLSVQKEITEKISSSLGTSGTKSTTDENEKVLDDWKLSSSNACKRKTKQKKTKVVDRRPKAVPESDGD